MNDNGELLSEESKQKITSTNNIILVILVLIAAFASVGELSITIDKVVNLSLLVIFLYIVCSLVYSNRYTLGMVRMKESEEYTQTKKEYDAAVKEIYDNGLLPRVPEFCERYRREELKSRRAEILGDQCISYDDYEGYRTKTKKELEEMNLTPEAIKCISYANRLKGMIINNRVLMTDGEGAGIMERVLRRFGFRPGIGMEAKTRQRIDYGVNMFSRAVTTLFAGAVGITIFLDRLSWQAISQWALRMFPIAWSALVAYPAGGRNVSETLIPQLKRKTSILKLFAIWGREPEEDTRKNQISEPQEN